DYHCMIWHNNVYWVF
nr:immunoglobulin light chain junction region [Macaca mulatta]